MQDRIKLAPKESCTGCAVCASICPMGCVKMVEDREGFLQPKVDSKACVRCHKCEKTCPILNPLTIPTDFETKAYAAINKDEEVRMRSSSGGVFHALAKWTIEHGGVVFGARFNDQWEVVHDYTETLEGIEPLMRSKYVQSRIGDTFKQAKQFLDQGRQVLFVGTPCQIGGLKSYLHKEYDKLIAVDLICHGVPSPKIWRKYLKEITNGETLVNIVFRNKDRGWIDGSRCVIKMNKKELSERYGENSYVVGFENSLFLRRCCYRCHFKTLRRHADITIADSWGVQVYCPSMFDNKGTSLLLEHSGIGKKIIDCLPDLEKQKVEVSDALQYNKRALQNVPLSKTRSMFFILNTLLSVQNNIKCAKYYSKIYKNSIR